MRTAADVMADIERLIYSPTIMPYRGWHDDHRHLDPGPNYMPAMQQVRSEFEHLIKVIGMWGDMTRCLQLGLGPSRVSHGVWGRVFVHVVTVDLAMCIHDAHISRGRNTHESDGISFAMDRAPYDFLFIDAGHSYVDVAADYKNYAPMVRHGGLIAFHDALPRAKYPEIEVHKFIEHLPVTVLGDEVGTAVMEVT